MRVLIVDDSPVTRILLRSLLEGEGYHVREAASGDQALKILVGYTPDIVTMDVHMPGMDGFETTERILTQYAVPVVIVTASANPYAAETAMRSLEAGALAVLEKPSDPGAPDFPERVSELLRTLRSLSQVKVVRRQRNGGPPKPTPPFEAGPHKPRLSPTVADVAKASPQLVAIAASAGGPAALKTLLAGLGPQPWPIVVVQHIAAGFLPSFCHWLESITTLPVVIAQNHQTLRPGVVHLAPDGFHLGFAADHHALLDSGPPDNHLRPSANHLFRSAALRFGSRVIGIQLSGMGRDGAEGMAELYRAGALTIAQEPASALIDSMPLAVIGLQVARQVLPPENIAVLLNGIAAQVASQSRPG